MQRGTAWYRAIAISCVINLGLILGIGAMATRIFQTSQLQMIEVELKDDNISQESLPTSVTPVLAKGQSSDNPIYNVSNPSTSVLAAPNTASNLNSADPYSRNSNPATVSDGADLVVSETMPPVPVVSRNSEVSRSSPPKIITRVDPEYPEQAWKDSIEGVVKIKLEISEFGRCTSVSIVNSSGNDSLDRAAVDVVKFWKFDAAKDEMGNAVQGTKIVEVTFQLN